MNRPVGWLVELRAIDGIKNVANSRRMLIDSIAVWPLTAAFMWFTTCTIPLKPSSMEYESLL